MKKILWLFIFWQSLFMSAQDKTNKIKIYYDCQANYCEETYLKQNLKGVEFVRDRNFADVHIIILSEQNGSGGQKVHLNFIGQNDFKQIQDKYDFSIGTDDTRDQIRKKLLKYLQLGLVRYWYQAGMADHLAIHLNIDNQKKQSIDKWHHWVFKIGGHAWFNGDSNTSNRNLSAYAKASKVEENNKFHFV